MYNVKYFIKGSLLGLVIFLSLHTILFANNDVVISSPNIQFETGVALIRGNISLQNPDSNSEITAIHVVRNGQTICTMSLDDFNTDGCFDGRMATDNIQEGDTYDVEIEVTVDGDDVVSLNLDTTTVEFDNNNNGSDDNGTSNNGNDGGSPSPGVTGTKELSNPIAITSIQDFLKTILLVVRVMLIPIVIFFIIYSGFQYVMARGNSEALNQAKRSLIFAIIGGLIIVGVNVIITIIESSVQPFMDG